MDIHHYMRVDCETAAHECGWRRVLCYLEATLVKAFVEAGHAWVHLKRGRPDMLLRRFDWYCGLDSGAMRQEQANSIARFVGFVFPVLVWYTLPGKSIVPTAEIGHDMVTSCR